MFGIGMPELVIIMVIALVVIGPQKLPEMAKSLGKGLAEFKKASSEIRNNFEAEARNPEEKSRLPHEEQVDLASAGQAAEPVKEPAAQKA